MNAPEELIHQGPARGQQRQGRACPSHVPRRPSFFPTSDPSEAVSESEWKTLVGATACAMASRSAACVRMFTRGTPGFPRGRGRGGERWRRRASCSRGAFVCVSSGLGLRVLAVLSTGFAAAVSSAAAPGALSCVVSVGSSQLTVLLSLCQ